MYNAILIFPINLFYRNLYAFMPYHYHHEVATAKLYLLFFVNGGDIDLER